MIDILILCLLTSLFCIVVLIPGTTIGVFISLLIGGIPGIFIGAIVGTIICVKIFCWLERDGEHE